MSRIDWEAVERDYRTGKNTTRELGAKHGCTHGAFVQRARKHGWTQDLTKAIRQATDAKVIEAEVSSRLSTQLTNRVTSAIQETANTVLVAAEMSKDVILRHRQDIRSTRYLAMQMLGELAAVTASKEEVERVFKSTTEDMNPAQLAHAQRAYRNLVELPNRIQAVDKLADTLGKLQPIERKAFRLDEEGTETKESLADQMAVFLTQIHSSGDSRIVPKVR
jgi:hypothetical protein